jgi:hypothetical protein
MRKNEWGLSMNRRFGVPALAGPGRLKAGHQTSFAAQPGSWSQCMRKKPERGLSMNRMNFEYALALKAAEDRRTPRRWRDSQDRVGGLKTFKFISGSG